MAIHGPEVVLSLCKGATLSPVQSWLDLPVGLLRHFPLRRGGEGEEKEDGEEGETGKEEVVELAVALALTVAVVWR